MYEIEYANNFKKNLRRCKRQGKNIELLKPITDSLISGEPLHKKYKDHSLIGDLKGCRDCRIGWDWQLIYRIDEKEKVIEYLGTGSHPELGLG